MSVAMTYVFPPPGELSNIRYNSSLAEPSFEWVPCKRVKYSQPATIVQYPPVPLFNLPAEIESVEVPTIDLPDVDLEDWWTSMERSVFDANQTISPPPRPWFEFEDELIRSIQAEEVDEIVAQELTDLEIESFYTELMKD